MFRGKYSEKYNTIEYWNAHQSRFGGSRDCHVHTDTVHSAIRTLPLWCILADCIVARSVETFAHRASFIRGAFPSGRRSIVAPVASVYSHVDALRTPIYLTIVNIFHSSGVCYSNLFSYFHTSVACHTKCENLSVTQSRKTTKKMYLKFWLRQVGIIFQYIFHYAYPRLISQ